MRMYPLHQVKVYDSQGRFLRAIGKPGGPQVGPYDELRMHYPRGIAVTDDGVVWVAERDKGPKRVSRWRTGGTFLDAIYGPPKYGGGVSMDPLDRERFWYGDDGVVMEFRADWATGRTRLAAVKHRLYRHHWGTNHRDTLGRLQGLDERASHSRPMWHCPPARERARPSRTGRWS